MKVSWIPNIVTQQKFLWEHKKYFTDYAQLKVQKEYECVAVWTYQSDTHEAAIFYGVLDVEGTFAQVPSQLCMNVSFDEADKSWVSFATGGSIHFMHPDFKKLNDQHEDVNLHSDVREKLARIVQAINKRQNLI